MRRFFMLCIAFIGIPFFAFAQTQEDNQEFVVVANIEAKNVHIVEQEGNKVRVQFDLVNEGKTAQSDIRYALELTQTVPDEKDKSVVYHEKVSEHIFEESLALNAGERVSRTVTYEIPQIFSGGFMIMLRAQTTNGLPLAIVQAGNIAIAQKPHGILLDNCFTIINGGAEIFNKSFGVDIDKDEKLTLQCDVHKNDFDGQATPHFTTYRRNAFGEQVDQKSLPKQALEADKRHTWDIPVHQKPQVYDAVLDLRDDSGNVISNQVTVHYVVRGDSGTIISAQLDKTQLHSGDTATAQLDIAGRADVFMGSRAYGEESPKDIDFTYYVSVDIHDKNKSLCGGVAEQKVENAAGLMPVRIPVTRDCTNPKLTVKLLNAQKEIIDTKTFAFESAQEQKTEKQDTMQKIFYGVLIATLILIIGILIHGTLKKRRGLATFLALLFACGIFFSSSEAAHALTFQVPPPKPWASLGYAMNIVANVTTQCDRSAAITGYVHIKQCANAWVRGIISIDGVNVLNHYCAKGGRSENCGTYSFSKTKLLPAGKYVSRIQADYKIKQSKYNKTAARALHYRIPKCPNPTCSMSFEDFTGPGDFSGNLVFSAQNYTGTPQCKCTGSLGAGKWIDLNPGTYAQNFSEPGTKNCTCIVKDNSGAQGECNAAVEVKDHLKPQCGTRALHYEWEVSNWPSGSTFCSEGVVVGNPAFPGYGGTATWTCKNPKNETVTCQATHDNPPPCECHSSVNGKELQYNHAIWTNFASQSTQLCGRGTISPSLTPPGFGETRNYTCTGADCTGTANCSIKRSTPPECACGSTNNTTTLSKPTSNLCAQGDASSISGNGKWTWHCGTPNVENDGTGGVCTNRKDCSAQCIDVKVIAPSSYYVDKDGNGTIRAKMKLEGKDKIHGAIQCTINGKDVSFPSGSEMSDPVDINVSGNATLQGQCNVNVSCDGTSPTETADPPIPPVYVTAMCVQRDCNAQGKCQATPKPASGSCTSTCSSDADCRSGRLIETRP